MDEIQTGEAHVFDTALVVVDDNFDILEAEIYGAQSEHSPSQIRWGVLWYARRGKILSATVAAADAAETDSLLLSSNPMGRKTDIMSIATFIPSS